MAAKWQQWFPFRIDAFRGSPTVQAMDPAARAGYIYLLAAAWQTDDCSIPSDETQLALISGLGIKLWKKHGTAILAKFSVNSEERLVNHVLLMEWKEAKRIFECRKDAAKRTNEERSPHGHRTVTDGIASRSPNTRTTVVSVGVNVPVSSSGITPEMLARGVAEILGLSLGYGPGSLNTALTEVAQTELKAGRDLESVAVEMEAAYRFYEQEKHSLRIQWGPAKFFGDGHWRNPDSWPRREETNGHIRHQASVGTAPDREEVYRKAAEAADEANTKWAIGEK